MYSIAEGLNIVPVGSYNDIRIRMNEGNRQRTIAATKMNETSRSVTQINVHVNLNNPALFGSISGFTWEFEIPTYSLLHLFFFYQSCPHYCVYTVCTESHQE